MGKLNLNNKTIVITGAASGIGKALTLNLLQRGSKIAAVDISQMHLDQLHQELEPNFQNKITLHQADLGKSESIETLVKELLVAHDSIDGLINNAGIIQPFLRVNDLSTDAIHKVMDVDFYGPVYLTKALLPHLLEQPRGLIANVSSMGGFLPVPGQSVYGAAKAGIKLFTEALYAELLDSNVQVSVIFPGAIDTNIMDNSGVKAPSSAAMEEGKSKFKPLPAKEAAQIIAQGIEKGKARIFVGSDSKMMDLLYRISPTFAIKMIAKQMKELLP